MKTTVFYTNNSKGTHDFYVKSSVGTFFLFSQDYRKGVHEFFENGILLDNAFDFSKCRCDSSVIRTIEKIPMYIKYVEKEYGIEILEQTKKKTQKVKRKSDNFRQIGYDDYFDLCIA